MHKTKSWSRTALLIWMVLPVSGLRAQPNPPAPALQYLSPKDTLFLTVEKGVKVIQHPVKPKQTLFSLARYYGMGLEELYEYNPGFEDDPTLKVGARISIPIPNRAIKRYKTNGFNARKHAPIYYIVQPGDNLFQISQRYFKMHVDSIVERNQLTSKSIQPGQFLHVGWMGLDGVLTEWRTARPVTPYATQQERFEREKARRRSMSSQGMCDWPHENGDANGTYALHREAAIGTVKTAYVKVIGRIAANQDHSTEVILAPAAARYIGAKKTRFFVKVRFLR
jgi:LysM repeat protein